MAFLLKHESKGVLTLTLNRPEKNNAFHGALLMELEACFEELHATATHRVVVLQANGKHFCAGADLETMQNAQDFTEVRAEAAQLLRVLNLISTCPLPVIAKVHGAVYGGGLGITAAADLVVANADAKFAFSEVKLGLSPSVISNFVLSKTSTAFAKRYFLTAEVFSATVAQTQGLVHEIAVDESSAQIQVQKWCDLLQKNSHEAITATKELLQQHQVLNQKDYQAYTCEHIALRRRSSDAQERLLNFFKKTKS